MGNLGSIPGLGRSPGEGKSYPLQYSGLENSIDCIVCIVHGIAKSQTRLSDFHFHFPQVSLILLREPCVFQNCFFFPSCLKHVGSPGIFSPHFQSDPSSFSHVQLFVTQWTVACQVPLSMGFPRQEYWRGFPFPSPGDLPDPGIELASLASFALAGEFFTTSTTWETLVHTQPLATHQLQFRFSYPSSNL